MSDVLRSYDELFPSRPELDLKNFWELRLDLFKKVLHFVRVLDQDINQSREQVLHTSKLARDTSQLRLLIIYIRYGWAYGCRVKWEQLSEVETLKRRQRLACHRERKVQINQEYDIPFPEKDW
jgi:hypothetical protein